MLALLARMTPAYSGGGGVGKDGSRARRKKLCEDFARHGVTVAESVARSGRPPSRPPTIRTMARHSITWPAADATGRIATGRSHGGGMSRRSGQRTSCS